MKKITFVTILMLCLGFIMASCTKKEDTPKLDDRLVGTKWVCSNVVPKLNYRWMNKEEGYEFFSTTEVLSYATNNGNVVGYGRQFSYTLNYPSITIGEVKYKFIDSRTMVRDGKDETEPYAKYIRQ